MVELEIQARESGKLAQCSKFDQLPAKTGDGFRLKSKKNKDGLAPTMGTRVSGKVSDYVELANAGGAGRLPVGKILRPVISTPTKATSNPSKPGMEQLKGRVESKGDGQPTLRVRLELLAIKRTLTKPRSEVDGGIEKLEAVLGSLEPNRPKLGFVESQTLGSPEKLELGFKEKEKAYLEASFLQLTGPKHKKNRNKKKKKKKPMRGDGRQGMGF
jgi:hypothetical protein